jgi:SnoaL-like domain
MSFAVPEPVAAYFAAEAAKNADPISRCFAQDGAVRDEGREYRGRDAIRQWKAAADAKYQYVLEMVDVRTLGDLVTVRARLTGKFPGSPIELDHIFKLSGDKIASLEIRS